MSGIGSTGSTGSSSSDSVTFGTNIPPVSFPGIASGIDYNAIIQKLSALAYAPVQTDQAHVKTLNTQNTELVKINGLLASVQTTMTALTNPSLFQSVSFNSGMPSVATASQVTGQTALPGTYTIDSVAVGTATTIVANDSQNGYGAAANAAVVLNNPNVNLAITPTTTASGTGAYVSLNGVKINYDLSTSTINTAASIVTAINAVTAQTNVTASYNAATGIFTLTDGLGQNIALGASGDTGNLWQVLKLDTAAGGSTISSGVGATPEPIGGVNAQTSYDATGNAGFTTPVTVGTFTINGVSITVGAGTNLTDTINAINASTAGVIASFNASTGQIALANKNPGNTTIVLGSGTDTSNWLTATGLNQNTANTVTTVGTQTQVTYQGATGPTTVYSDSNNVAGIIPGATVNVSSNDAATPFNITVAADPTAAENSINAFVTAYNAAIDEIDQATAAPVVTATSANSSTTTTHQAVGGGVLFGNSDVLQIRDQLVNLVTNLITSNNASSSYNSLSSVGLNLDNSFTQLTSNNASGNTADSVSVQSFDGTSGKFLPLDTTTFATAYAANPQAVANLFTGVNGILVPVGEYLTQATGFPTLFADSVSIDSSVLQANAVPNVSLMQNFQNLISDQVSGLQQQIQLITDSVNMQANEMRAQFVSSETQMSQLQALQSQLASFLGGSSSSSSGS